MACPDENTPLDFESLLADPLTRLMMASDGVTEPALRALLEQAAVARQRDMPPEAVAGDPPPG
jgi:hypothetical protein